MWLLYKHIYYGVDFSEKTGLHLPWCRRWGCRCAGHTCGSRTPHIAGSCRRIEVTPPPRSCLHLDWTPPRRGSDLKGHDIINVRFCASEISTGKVSMCLLPDTQNYGMRMRLECRECFPRHRLQRKPLISDPGMHHGTCVTHVSWCMSGSQTRGSGENVHGIPAHAQPAILRILQEAQGEE